MAAQSWLVLHPEASDEATCRTVYALSVVPKPAPQQYPRVGSPAGASMRIVDRTDELPALRSLLLDDEVRLLTLMGPGGVGKTRLALEAGRDLAQHFAVCFPLRSRLSSALSVSSPAASRCEQPKRSPTSWRWTPWRL